MISDELKHILIAYKSTNIGLQQAHDEIMNLLVYNPENRISDREYYNLLKQLYPKDNSKKFRRK